MFSTVIDLHIHTKICGGSNEISNREGAENSDWKRKKCNTCMNKAQEVAVMELLGNPDNGGFDCLFSSILEFKVLFSQPPSYKDELGKILYVVVFMAFLNTNGSIVSFGKKKKWINDTFPSNHYCTKESRRILNVIVSIPPNIA